MTFRIKKGSLELPFLFVGKRPDLSVGSFALRHVFYRRLDQHECRYVITKTDG